RRARRFPAHRAVERAGFAYRSHLQIEEDVPSRSWISRDVSVGNQAWRFVFAWFLKFLGPVEFRAAFQDRQFVYWTFCRCQMNRHLESVDQQGLKHLGDPAGRHSRRDRSRDVESRGTEEVRARYAIRQDTKRISEQHGERRAMNLEADLVE